MLAAAAVLGAACSSAPKSAAPEVPAQPSPPSPVPAVPEVAPAAAPRRQTTVLPNGMTAVVTTVASGRPATLQFAVLAGAALVAPGAAELAAAVLVDGADPGAGRLPLRTTIAAIGGTLDVHVGPLTTWIDLRVPGDRWRDALIALRDALAGPTQSRHRIERIRDQHVDARAAAVRQQPVAATAAALLLGEKGPAELLLGLLDRDAGEISLFVSRLYRPERAVLALALPVDAATVTTALAPGGAVGLGGWSPPAPVPGATPLLDRAFTPGLHWAPSPPGETPPRCRVGLVSMLPDPRRPDAADVLLLHACFTLDGAGGRLEQLQRDRGLGHVQWRASVVQTPDATALLLEADVVPTQVVPLWRTVQLARESLRDVPPTESEIATAAVRVPLTARLGATDDGARLRLATMMQLGATDFGAIDRRVARIAASRDRDLRAATAALLAQPLAMVAIGGAIPADAGTVHRFELLPAAVAPPPTAAGTGTPPAATNAWLEGAVDAAGGAELLRRLRGWTAVAEVLHEQAPTMAETLTFSTTGDLERSRQVLGQTIETTLRGDRWSERMGETVRSLDARDVAVLRREASRHPLALLAAHVRGELVFRTVAVRTTGDRTVAILEADGGDHERLRLHVDTDSYLVRVVESWDPLADGTIVHLHDAWHDYRTCLGLRAPFRRLCTQDDGRNRVETRFSQWTPRFGTR